MIRDPQRSLRTSRGLERARSKKARLCHSFFALALLAGLVSGLLPLPTGPTLESASAHHANIKLPVPGGESWRVSQGYNTSPAEGGSHYSCDPSTLRDQPSQTRSCSAYWQYKYSLDIVAVDGVTAGRTVVSPVNGTIRWIDQAYGGMSIDLGDGYAYAFFHAALAPGLSAGQTLTQGQYLGTVATAGNGGNGGFPHLHVTIWQTNDGGNWSRNPVPFSGAQTIDGVSLPAGADSERNQHRGVVIRSSNTVVPAAEQPPAPPLLQNPPHGTTYRVNSQIVTLGWAASTGATSYQVVINDGAITSPWVNGTSWTTGTLTPGQYAWQVRARNAAGQSSLSPKWVFWVDPAGGGGEPTPPGTPGGLAVALSPTSGAPGVNTTASGGGMNANERVDIFWDSVNGTQLGGATANAAGNWTATLQIPDATGGSHKIVVRGVTSGKTAEAAFSVSSALVRTPYQGPPGTSIAITVKGFGPNETVNLTFMHGGGSNVSLGSTTTNSSGTGTLTATMPEATTGWHDYQGRGQTSGRIAWGALNVQPVVTLSTSQGSSGASVTAMAKGFPGGQSIRVAWNQSGSSSGTTLCNGTTSSTGSATCSFSVPQAVAGSYPITATTNDGTNASANFGVAGAAALTLTPARGPVGTQFQVSVGGFQAGERVRLTIDGSSTTWQEATVTSTGSVLVKSTIPFLTNGNHTITARGLSSSRTASATLSVTPSMEITPSGGAAGSNVNAYVRGMKANTSVSVRFNATSASNGTSVCSGTTGSNGAFSCTFKVPSITGGATYPLLAASGGLTATTNFAVTSGGAVDGGAVIGLGTYQVTATQEGLVGGTTSNGHVIVPDDHFVALPACTPSNCPWLAGGSTSPTLGYITDCGDNCFVRVTNPVTGICRVEPIWDTGPWFTNDNWWEPAERRNLNNLPGTVNTLPQGYPGVDAARDGLNVGYGLSGRGIGISNVGYEVGNRAAIDIADGTWKDIGFADGAGPRTVVVSMLWQTGENPATARQSCLGDVQNPGPGSSDPSISISPTGGVAGTQVTVTGTGYGNGERVDIYWDSTYSGSPIQSIVANSSGSFAVTITIPDDELGRHLIVGKGAASGLKPSRSFTIVPKASIQIDPLTGPAGSRVAVTGVGFAPGEAVSIYWDSTGSTGSRLSGTTATSTGTISATVTVPNATSGDHLIVGLGESSGAKASRTFNLAEATSPDTDPRISIDRTSGPAGSSVVVTGTGYGNGERVEIYWNSTFSGSPLTTVTANGSGGFSTTITIPNDELGRHLIVGKGLTSDKKPSRSFTIVPRTMVALSSYEGAAGSTITVTGEGYGANEQVAVFWDSTGSTGTRLTTVTANGSGSFTANVTIPTGDAGGHYIVGLGLSSGSKASRTYTLTDGAPIQTDPRISIDPTSGPAGTRVTVTGTGYEPNEVVDIFWGSTFTGLNLGNVTAGGNGSFSIPVTVPDASDGRHLIVGKGRSSGAKPSRSFTVETVVLDARVSISTTDGPVGSSVTVTGTGYAPNEQVDIYWDSTGSSGRVLGSARASSSGGFTTTISVPEDTGGRHLIVGKGAGSGQKPSRSYYISPSTTANATNVTVGQSVTLTLRGFQSGDSVAIYWDEASGTPLTTVTANSRGSASATITIPQTVNGAHQVVATAGITAGGTASFNVSGGSTAAATASFGASTATYLDRVTIQGANFWSNEQVQLFWDDQTSPSATLQSGFSGSVSSQITIPTLTGGAHTVTLKGVSSGKSATATITITPLLVLTPPIGEAGARIVADVKGWTPGMSVTIYFDRPAGGSGGTAVCTATGRASGTASCSFAVPSGYAVGTEVPVTASGSAGSSTVTLRITNTPVGFGPASTDETDEEAPEATETPTATPVGDEATETPTEATPDGEGTPEPTEDIEETPVPTESETPVDEPAETPSEEATEEVTEEVTEEPSEEPTEEVTEEATEIPTEVVTEVPTEEPTPEPTVAPEPRYVTSYAVSDVTVYSARPDEQPGDELGGALGAGGADGAVTYISFNVEGIGAGTVTNAQLVLTGAGATAAGSVVGLVPGYWVDEASAVYASVPPATGPAVDTYGGPVYLPALSAGQEVRLDVTGAIVGDGIITFVVTGDPTMIATMMSRESGVAPRLEITVLDQ